MLFYFEVNIVAIQQHPYIALHPYKVHCMPFLFRDISPYFLHRNLFEEAIRKELNTTKSIKDVNKSI